MCTKFCGFRGPINCVDRSSEIEDIYFPSFGFTTIIFILRSRKVIYLWCQFLFKHNLMINIHQKGKRGQICPFFLGFNFFKI